MPNHMQLDEEESGASPGLSAALRHQRNNSVSSDSTGYMSSGSSEDDERPERVPQVTKQRQQRLRWQLQGAAMGRGPSTLNGIGETSNAPIISSLSSLEASTAAAADRTRRYRAPSASSTGSGTALAQSDVIEDPGIIYHNLLLFEQSLRDAFSREQRLKRKYTIFWLLLLLWTAFFAWIVFFYPYPYYYILLFGRLFLLLGLVTVSLFHLSGQYRRTIQLPRRFIPNINKPLRLYNLKIIRNPHRKWWLPFWWRKRGLAQGGVRLVLVGKKIDVDFREGWELFRSDYWDYEEQRLARKVKKERASRRKASSAISWLILLFPWRAMSKLQQSSQSFQEQQPSQSTQQKKRLRKPSNLGSGYPIRDNASSTSSSTTASTQSSITSPMKTRASGRLRSASPTQLPRTGNASKFSANTLTPASTAAAAPPLSTTWNKPDLLPGLSRRARYAQNYDSS